MVNDKEVRDRMKRLADLLNSTTGSYNLSGMGRFENYRDQHEFTALMTWIETESVCGRNTKAASKEEDGRWKETSTKPEAS